MRTCMYCGKELEAGEMCNCSASRIRRGETGAAANEAAKENEQPETKKRSRYKTGYAGGDNRFERARDRYNAKRAAKKKTAKNTDGFFSDLWHYVISAVKTPVDAVTNPKQLGKGAMLIIAAALGAVLWLCMFFIMRGGAVGPFRLIASAMSFNGSEGYRLLASIGLCLISGALSGIVIFFIYTGIFYLVNRFIMRMKTSYWDFCVRLVTAWIPFTVICLIGTVLSILSPITLAAMVACGAVTVAALTYEALKTEWIAFPPSKVLLGMTLGYFVFFIFMGHLMLLG